LLVLRHLAEWLPPEGLVYCGADSLIVEQRRKGTTCSNRSRERKEIMAKALAALAGDTLDLLREVSTVTVTTQLLKKAGMRSRHITGAIPLNQAVSRFVGVAYTMRFVPLREDLEAWNSLEDSETVMLKVMDGIPPGSVLVVDAQGISSAGVIGDILAGRILARGGVALVTDGAMRDVGPLRRMALPIFCRALTAPPTGNGLVAAGAQEVIGCGGVAVIPGDVVVGDEDGVVVIPRHLADTVAKAGLEQERLEAWVKRKIEKGSPVFGLYPPNEDTKAEYARWIEAGRP
jgi:regulator of RNase E activity RraA